MGRLTDGKEVKATDLEAQHTNKLCHFKAVLIADTAYHQLNRVENESQYARKNSKWLRPESSSKHKVTEEYF